MDLLSVYDTAETTEADILNNTTGSAVTIIGIDTVNTDSSSATIELWVTDGSNVHQFPVLSFRTLESGSGISDKTRRSLPDGWKVRGEAGTASVVYVNVNYLVI